ncbi:M10 family metallopeptidase [Aureimonas psammosilenae]|uniref:M10 family metallopeptidase n=1 Tax=Aureimonas psammosilenae TaxID=2495496 RepID=UPI001261381A|nr:M10 family metallopeptidase [Aureimonas psammosilenae]
MPAITAATMTGRSEIDALLVGSRWSDPTVTFGFASRSSDYSAGYDGNYPSSVQTLGASQQVVFRAALSEWSAVANLNFVETLAATATIRVGVTNAADTAFAYFPTTLQEGGDVWIGTGIAAQSPVTGSYAYMAYVHELGHALGLGHPHEGANPGISDQLAYSVMSYRSYAGASFGYTVAEGSFPTSPMISDIAAIQTLYGANYASHAGADTYRWTPGTPVLDTIWDGGGIDTYDLSAFSTNLSVDLTPGGWTSFGRDLADLGNGQRPPGNVANALLYNNDTRSLIENAIAGAGHDLIRGNAASNDLTGGLGNDTIYGGANGDVLHGGAGDDLFYGGSGVNDPTDIGDVIFGEDGYDTIYGNGGDDQLYAGQGSALVYGGYGTDTISAEIVPGANVQLYGGGMAADPNDLADTITLTGNGPNALAQIFGNGGNDTLTTSISGTARVEIYGGFGNDAIRLVSGDAGASTLIVGGPGNDSIVVTASGSATIFGGNTASDPTDGGDRIDAFSSTGRLLIYGNGGDDVIIGGSNEDTIYGGVGNDVIIGGAGGDLMVGGEGADTFVIGNGDSLAASMDEIVGFESVDRLDLSVTGAGARFTEIQAVVSDGAQALAAAGGAFAAGALYVAVRAGADTYLFADYDHNRAGEWGVKLTGFSGSLDPSSALV